jgi:hypothetical protein
MPVRLQPTAPAAVLSAVIGRISDALGDTAGAAEQLAPAELVGRHALRADELAALAESVLAAEQARHGHPQTLRRLHQLAFALGEQCGQLDELADRLQRGDRR